MTVGSITVVDCTSIPLAVAVVIQILGACLEHVDFSPTIVVPITRHRQVTRDAKTALVTTILPTKCPKPSRYSFQ